MARGSSKNGSALLGLAILVGIPIWIVSKITDSIGVDALVGCTLALIALVVLYLVRKRAARLAYLRAKYGDETTVRRIMRRQFWQGQTSEQLLDSLGTPPARDHNLLKTRKREIWKFQNNGVNRYRLRITLDDDVVVGWNQKS